MSNVEPTDQPVPLPIAPDEPPKSASWKAWAAACALAVVLVVAGVFLLGGSGSDDTVDAAAATNGQGQPTNGGFPGGGQLPGARGEVTAVDGNTLTVESQDFNGDTQTVTVKTSSDTEVTESVEATVADLASGDQLTVIGEEADDGTITATAVVEGSLGFDRQGTGGTPPEGFEPPEGVTFPEGATPPEDGQFPGGGNGPGGFTSGTLVSATDSSLTIETDDGETVEVAVTGDTTVTTNETRAVSDIEVGDTVMVNGDTDDSTVTADSIRIGDLGGPGGGGFPGGGAFPGGPGGSGTGGSVPGQDGG